MVPRRDGAETIAVTILGGYLGSGKTTRINTLLAEHAQEARIAVVVNDFGAVNIDADLVKARSGDMLELSNGCICCSLADGMAAVMERLAALDPCPAHVVMEVSGVGNPGEVARWAGLPGFRRNAVVVCADAETIEERASDRWVADTVRTQLASADLLLLTKTDLVGHDELAQVRAWLESTVPGVPVHDDLRTLDALLVDPLNAPTSRAGTRSPSGQHDEHVSWAITSSDPVDADRVLDYVRSLPDHVVRAKGVLRTWQQPDRRTVVQRVGRRWEAHDDGPWQAGDTTRLVVISPAASGLPEELPGLNEVFAS